MITKMLLLVSRFKDYSFAGITHPYVSVSSLFYVKLIENGSYICDLTLEQITFDYYEVFDNNVSSFSYRR